MTPHESPENTAAPSLVEEEVPELIGSEKPGYHTQSSHPVFVVDDTFFRARTPKATHWSIAWSDLMMTMFVLFLTLFVYQLTNREFLSEEPPEVVAGSVMPIPDTSTTTVPFHPISPSISSNQRNQLKKIQPTPQEADPIDTLFEESFQPEPIPQLSTDIPENEKVESLPKEIPPAVENSPDDQVKKPISEQGQAEEKEAGNTVITRMYDLSKVTVTSEKLEKFASIELVPDKTMRIILTGDLLFESGQAELTRSAKESLRKLIPIIQQTPYMINVIGHTDSIPMHSARFSSNWELSTARAGQVARFLIDEGHVPARQLVVSGYSYFRPVKPNTTAANRKANRRVELILSKEPPPAQSATEINVQ